MGEGEGEGEERWKVEGKVEVEGEGRWEGIERTEYHVSNTVCYGKAMMILIFFLSKFPILMHLH